MEGGEIGLSGDGEWDLRYTPAGFGIEEEKEEEDKVEIKEEMIVEMMRWLEREITSSKTTDHGRGTSFVTINGNEESCGPSFSDSASTVMASIDTRGVGGVAYFVGWPTDPATVGASRVAAGVGPWDGKLMWPPAVPAVKQEEEDEEDDDEEWLARVLGGAGFELEMGEEELFM